MLLYLNILQFTEAESNMQDLVAEYLECAHGSVDSSIRW